MASRVELNDVGIIIVKYIHSYMLAYACYKKTHSNLSSVVARGVPAMPIKEQGATEEGRNFRDVMI